MPTFDFLGLKKDLAPEPEGAAAAQPKTRALSPKAWVALAAADLVVALLCGAFLYMRVGAALEAPVPAPRPVVAKPAPKAPEKPAEPAKAPEAPKKPETAKAETPKAEPVKAAPEPSKVPLGSPSVHATPPPPRQAAPKAAAAAPSAPAKKAQTRPVPFSLNESDAKEVALVGPFLVRSGGRKMMFKDSKGVWTTTVYLVVGQTYKYRFEVSGPKGKKLTPYQKVEVLDGE